MMATDLSSLTFSARVGMPLLIQPVQILDKVSDRNGSDKYLVRITADSELNNQVQLIEPSDIMSVIEEDEDEETA
jgi:hypothetical protein